MIKIIRTSTVPISLNILLKGQLKFLNNRFKVFGVSSEGEDLNEVAKREGIATAVVDMERGINPVKDIISLVKLYFLIKKEKPTIVHSITPKAGLLTMLAGKIAGVPIRMHTYTGLIFPSSKGIMQQLLIKMDQLLCWAATHVYPEGSGVKQDLLKYNITTKKLKVLANGNVNGIDLDYFSKEALSLEALTQLKLELGITDNDFVFIFVGRLVGDKGINELVAAFKRIKIDNVKLLLVGSLEPELDPLTSETLDEISNNPTIIATGFQRDVRAYLAISNALSFPSYREGFPNVVMQAGAMELPSIVSNINGCNEIIVEGENGVIIPVKDTDQLYEAMKRILVDSKFYNKLKSNARKMITTRYEQSVVWDAILAEYEILLKQKNLNHV